VNGRVTETMVQALSEIPSAARNPYLLDKAFNGSPRSTHHATSASTM
jgi:hypothetical protein